MIVSPAVKNINLCLSGYDEIGFGLSVMALSKKKLGGSQGGSYMPSFIINRNPQPKSGEYEVHNTTAGCSYMPKLENQIALGVHADCHGAVAKAKSDYPNERSKINGCYYCCNACHTG